MRPAATSSSASDSERRSVNHCSHPGHQLDNYTEEHRELLASIAELNDGILAACRSGKALSRVLAVIDPDPARYMFVDEGRDTLRRQLVEANEALLSAVPIRGHRRISGITLDRAHFATRPTIGVRLSGKPVIAWIEWREGIGEHVRVEVDGEAHTLNPTPADCFRPTVVVDAEDTPWVFWGMSVEGSVAVYTSRLTSDGWSDADQVSDTGHPSFNQEAVAHQDGSVELVWQGRTGDKFTIFARRWKTDSGWSDSVAVDDGTSLNVWDPTLSPLPDGGTVYAWCGFRDSRYRIHVRRSEIGEFGAVRTIDDVEGHALHPSIDVDLSGRVWCAFDTFSVQHHGGSGPTQLRTREDVGREFGWPGLGEPGLFMPPELVPPIDASVRVVEVGQDTTSTVPGAVGSDLHISPSAYPRVAVTSSGGVSVTYRILRRLPMMTYHWELATQHLGPSGWGPPITFEPSDGSLEEPAVTTFGDDLVVAWTSDGRAARNANWSDGFGGLECPDLRDHYGEVVWHDIHDAGQISWTRAPSSSAAPPEFPRTPTRVTTSGIARDRDQGRYQTTVNGDDLRLYWGDLHRHSLISRCTSGDEPAVDDMYRYAWDISDYDFWALTDHSENSTAFQWWTIQKAADLFHVPGRFVPFYGFEWTSPDTGHQNVIFDSRRRGAPIISSMAGDSDTPAKLWRHLRRFPDFPSITIPHHPGSAMVPFDWQYRDDDMVRIVEIFQSCRGSYETDGCFRQYSDATLPGTFVFDALQAGHRFGLIGSSDHGYGSGYLGAYAPDLDRASIYDAFMQRRTIAATRRDIVLDARIGGTFMGGATSLGDVAGPIELAVTAKGYIDIARVQFVKNGLLVGEVAPDSDLPDGWMESRIRVEWGWGPGTTDWSGFISIDGGEVRQTDFWSPEVTGFDRTTVRWRAVTTSFGDPYGHQRGGVELTVAGPIDALVRVETAAGRVVARLGTIIADGVVDGIVRGDGVLRIQPGVGGLTSLGTDRVDVVHVDTTDEPGWFVARAILVDGEMAWSSPIWVDR